MMRIVYLNPSGQMGGAETSLRELLASVRAAEPGWDIWLVLGENGPLADVAREIGVRVMVLPFPPSLARLGDTGKSRFAVLRSLATTAGGTALYARRLAQRMRHIQPHILHSNGFKMHLLGSWACPPKARLVWHIHDYVSTRPLMGRLLKHRAGQCAAAIANSQSVAADLRGILPNLKVQTIYNAIDLNRFAPAGTKLDLDRKAGLGPAGEATVRVGLVGTFARWKGHKVFLDALSRLPSSLPVRGYIVGGPIYQTSGSQWTMAELRGEADRLGLGGRVGFTGFLEDPAEAMRSLDIVVHASTQPEPFGMVVIEAMACGKAVIASAAGGATELFVEGENAVGHLPGDATALAGQMRRLVDDPQLRRRLGEAGRVAAEQIYHGRRLSSELLALYREISERDNELLDRPSHFASGGPDVSGPYQKDNVAARHASPGPCRLQNDWDGPLPCAVPKNASETCAQV